MATPVGDYYAAQGGGSFQDLLSMLTGGVTGAQIKDTASGAAKQATRLAGKYGPVISKGVTRGAPVVGAGLSLMQGDVGGALGSIGGGVLGAGLGPLGAIAGTTLGGMLGSGIQNAIAGAVQGGQDRQRERGESSTMLGLGQGKEVGDLNADELIDLMRRSGMSQVEIGRELNTMLQGNKDRDMNRQMQLNQQLGQLTGALNKQKYMAQLAGGAQAEAGATTRQVLSSENPYATSVFSYRG